MEKFEVQHNMFIELFPKEWFKFSCESPILIKKTDIKKCSFEHFREECRWNNRDREPIHVITVEMRDGTKYEEYYENLTQYGDYGMDDVKEIAENRYSFIKQQLCEI